MKKLSLIKTLNNCPENDSKTIEEDLSQSIEYQKYEITVDNKPQVVKIPKRETTLFENSIANIKPPITKRILRKILRDHRGLRG